jgi:uncharacterized membrane protein
MIRATTRFVSLLFSGLFAGFVLGILVLELSLRSVDAHVYTQTQHVALVGLPALATVLLIPAIVSTGILAAMTARTRGRELWFTLAALALLLTVFIVTLAVNVPINLAEVEWNVQSPPADWQVIRDRWQLGHAVRTGAAILAFAALAVVAHGVKDAVPQPGSTDRVEDLAAR